MGDWAERERTTAVIGAPPELFESDEDEGPLPAGTTLWQSKSFEIIEALGEGGMGRIYRAYDPNMDRYVALKVLKADVAHSERARFDREAKLGADFSHPNLVRVLEIGETDGRHWIAMEYLRGRDIAHVLERGRKANFRLTLEIFAQVLDALDYIHTRSLVHCDIKPENIFITRDVYDRRLIIAKLIDFGIARDLAAEAPTQEFLSGDPRYMAPEQAVLNGPFDGRVDLYALGMSFYELVAGRHPYEEHVYADDPQKLFELHARTPIEPISAWLPPGTPQKLASQLDRFCSQACAKTPDARFANAMAMKAALLGLRELVG